MLVKRSFFLVLLTVAALHSNAQSHYIAIEGSWLKELFSDRYFYRACDTKITYRYEFGDVGWCNFVALGSVNFCKTRYSATAFPTNDYREGFEVGFTGGVLWNIYLYEDYLTYYLGGFIGPQYTPDMPARQGGWLNFSDNLCSGFKVKIAPSLYGDVRFVFRHLSNAGFFRPNYGINSFGFGFGLAYQI